MVTEIHYNSLIREECVNQGEIRKRKENKKRRSIKERDRQTKTET